MRFNILDLIRFSAALGVVFYHYTSGESGAPFGVLAEFTKFGYLGVPLFFMISGFVISASALNHTPSEFVISRLTRLYPTIFVCLTLTTLVILTLGKDNISLFQYLTNLTVLNLYAGQPFIDGVYWTLLAELKFYFCVFLLLTAGWFHKFKIWLSIWMVMTITFLLFKQPFFMGWFISPEYSAFFIAGVAFFMVTRQGYDKYYSGLLLLALIVGLVRAYEQAGSFLHDTTEADRMIAVILTGGFFLLFYLISIERVKIRGNSMILLLGGMTYPLYLLHSKVGSILEAQLREYLNPHITVVFLVILMLFLSAMIHIYVERRYANPIKIWLIDRANSLKGEHIKVSS